jgi:hypothetical protein
MVAGETHLLRSSGNFPLAGKGNISTQSIFVELSLTITCNNLSKIGLIVPSSLATLDSQKELFIALVSSGRLRIFYDFENRLGIFPTVHRSYKFCLLVIGEFRKETSADYAFYLQNTEEIKNKDKIFNLTYSDLLKISPNTLSCPSFRNKSEAIILNSIYQQSTVILSEHLNINPWQWHSWQMFNETHESSKLKEWDSAWQDNRLSRFYEAKLIHQFDHRYATYPITTFEVKPDCF